MAVHAWQANNLLVMFEVITNISQPSVVTWPDVEQLHSDRLLKRTYTAASQFIEDHSIGQTLMDIARSDGLY